MSVAISPSNHQRSQGRAAISFKRRGPASVLDRLHQQGCAKIRLPKVYNLGCPEAVLLNTAGGLTGGDRFDVAARWGEGTAATLTTQAAERVYRSSGGTARVNNKLSVESGATAHWLPQETIVFDGAAIERHFDVDLDQDARLVAVESWMIGRHAMGEVVHDASIRDHWRIRRQGRLIFADTLRLNGDIQALLDRPAIAASKACFATLLIVAPNANEVRDRLRETTPCSAISDVVVARLFALDASDLRRRLGAVITSLSDTLGAASMRVPRVWHS